MKKRDRKELELRRKLDKLREEKEGLYWDDAFTDEPCFLTNQRIAKVKEIKQVEKEIEELYA